MKFVSYVMCVCLMLCLGFGCAPPSVLAPCKPCDAKESVCPDDFFCAHGFCLPKRTGLCEIPKVNIRIGEKERSIQGCEEGDVQECFVTSSPCHRGESQCFYGFWTKCESVAPLPSLGRRCSLGEGECLQKGEWKCETSKDKYGVLRCDASEKKPAEERCNGKDDDCDGTIDEALVKDCYTGPSSTVERGPCVRGKERCENGAWGACEGEVLPKAEECNGKDDDCDGVIDESLKRSCYNGPKGTDGVGPCKAGIQRCENGAWGACVGEVIPTKEQQCKPVLVHKISGSLLSCLADARSNACEVKGSRCEINGKKVEKRERSEDFSTIARCYASHTKTCGTFSSEGQIRRSWNTIEPESGHIAMDITGYAGSCACNGWCSRGCTEGGCCLTCNITARECSASSSYVATHHIAWKRALPTRYFAVLETPEWSQGSTLSVEFPKDTVGGRNLDVKKGLRCRLPLEKGELKLQILTSVSHSCAGSNDKKVKIVLRPAKPNETNTSSLSLLPLCFP